MQDFKKAVESQDHEKIEALLADDIVFRSPAVYKPYEGKPVVSAILRAVNRVFEDFRYTREIGDPGSPDSVLVFEARVGDRELEGADFIHVNADGLIDDLRVMIRPQSGLKSVVEGMGAALPAAMKELGIDPK
ncbi:SnoaL-like protein [Antricoccus suffuscus]|uniref:SnoaL-like protein n=1 Tax=Antricoccus suffuscus TaxID=1629062 RepID=A0A2T1A2F9_9ACTN|nr:nuclear transport factor 2 family protein [Antricoccus suffuscus]PRZ42518.1 SnoaL-like protein [Antricoccus suffuscus]